MQKSQDQKYWEKIGKTYSAFWRSKAKQEINKKELEFINKYLQKTKGKYILDIGIGTGRIIENYLSNTHIQAEKIYGVDWAKSMVHFCRNKFKNEERVQGIEFYNISEDQLPFCKEFDFISAIRVLKYNSNWPEIIGKIIKGLNKGGIFIFTIPNRNAFLRFTTPETSIHSTAVEEIENIIKLYKGDILQITSFMKLPDICYDLSENKFYIKAILLFEQFLEIIFGDVFWGRNFFIAVRKNR